MVFSGCLNIAQCSVGECQYYTRYSVQHCRLHNNNSHHTGSVNSLVLRPSAGFRGVDVLGVRLLSAVVCIYIKDTTDIVDTTDTTHNTDNTDITDFSDITYSRDNA